MELSIWSWLLALAPVLVVLVAMLGFQWGGSRAGALGWFTAFLIAALFFGAGFDVLVTAYVKSILLSLDVLLIIWCALLLFNIAREAGAIRMIRRALPALTQDRVMQSLLIGWLLVSFLQGTGGFGVPVAIVAPILVGLSFSPVQAVVIASIGHGWAVTFGSLASSFQSLMAVTDLPGELLAPLTAVLMGVACYPSGLLVAWIGAGWEGLKRAIAPVLVIGTVMGVVQYLLATHQLWTLGATGATIAGLLVMLIWLKWSAGKSKSSDEDALPPALSDQGKSLWLSMLAYGLLVVLAFSANLIPSLEAWLNGTSFTLHFPEVETAFGWVTPAGPGRVIYIFSHPGAILIYTCLIAYAIYRALGYIQRGAVKRILGNVLKSGVNSSLGILSMVGVASIMMHSGMTYLLAEGLSLSFSRTFYPVVAPFIGALGAFITGSNNNSNVLFAVLQQNTAILMDLPVPLILAAQTAGGALGSILAPAKVIVGCSTVGLAGKEGGVMRNLMLYGLITISTVALAALLIHLL